MGLKNINTNMRSNNAMASQADLERRIAMLEQELQQLRPKPPTNAPPARRPMSALQPHEQDTCLHYARNGQLHLATERADRLGAFFQPSDFTEAELRRSIRSNTDFPKESPAWPESLWADERAKVNDVTNVMLESEKACVMGALRRFSEAADGPSRSTFKDWGLMAEEQERNWYRTRAEPLLGLERSNLRMLPTHAPTVVHRGLRELHRRGLIRYSASFPREQWEPLLSSNP